MRQHFDCSVQPQPHKIALNQSYRDSNVFTGLSGFFKTDYLSKRNSNIKGLKCNVWEHNCNKCMVTTAVSNSAYTYFFFIQCFLSSMVDMLVFQSQANLRQRSLWKQFSLAWLDCFSGMIDDTRVMKEVDILLSAGDVMGACMGKLMIFWWHIRNSSGDHAHKSTKREACAHFLLDK